ncbi:hypothetical protein [Blastochloris sulfoviridis]|uniref:Uncharacterized protein n=1 Tax=Blastochloris sulfoviridis TaxID=50712 RepID=A0A5M6HNA8_9HYPH|nr:hypothetical protein [Blastochloris sulfoviridis]KAA5597305.1 hypothetical protein F1193_14330 [Blastochloris sulfoviridis]
MQELYRRMELAAVEVLAATQLTCLFGFMAWLGANSLAWGLGLVALGCAADLFRWFYRYDWQARRFVRNDLDARTYLAELERLLADDAAAKRMNRLHTKIVIAGCAVWLGLLLPIVLVNTIWGDAPFCAIAPALNAFDWPASQLVDVIRENERRLTAAGLHCRAVYLEIYYSVYYYLFVIGVLFYIVVVSDLIADNIPVQAVRKGRLPDLDAVLRSARLWRGLVMSALVHGLGVLTVLWAAAASMKPPGAGRSWNVHESNFHLFVLPFATIGIFVALSMVNYVYTACRADCVRRETQSPRIQQV